MSGTKVEGVTASRLGVVLRRSSVYDRTIPEVRLWLSVLCLAVDDAMLPPRKATRTRQAVLRDETRTARVFFSSRRLDYVCRGAGLNPVWVREVMRDYVGGWAESL